MAAQRIGHNNRALTVLMGVVLTVGAIYFGKPILMPLAMALLFTFLLTPVVHWLERRRLGRVPSVIVVVVVIGLLLSAVAWVVGVQLADLANHLPSYKRHLKGKLAVLRGSEDGPLARIRETVTAVGDEIEDATDDGQDKTPVVRVIPAAEPPWQVLKDSLTTAAAPLGTVAVIIVLAIFMLITREELRNRLVRLAGTGKITLTTKTLDEVQKRISRYLLMNALINGGFGLAVGVGLLSIGVHYALLWGFLAAALRFLPYVGPIVASVLPLGMAFLQSPHWSLVVATAVLFIILELITNNFVEPLAYGRSAGVSTVALLVAAAFWTWVWGPIGLLLSVPLTVVLAVLGKQIPTLEPLGILLGDEPALEPHVMYYQRLLAGDQEEAASIVDEQLKTHDRVEVYDKVVIPALVLAERDRNVGDLPSETEDAVWQSTRELLDDLASSPAATEDVLPADVEAPSCLRIVGCAAHDTADELALLMLGQVVSDVDCQIEILPRTTLAAEILEAFSESPPDLVIVSALGPGGVGKMRYLAKRIHMRFPDLKIVVGRWGYQGDRAQLTESMAARGADSVVTTLAEARDAILRVRPLVANTASNNHVA